MSDRMYTPQLSGGQIIFLAEMIVAGYCSTTRVRLCATLSNGYSFMAPLVEAALYENMRALLREPLRDPRFREEFNAYFSKHPNENIRDFGWEWMQEILVWEN